MIEGTKGVNDTIGQSAADVLFGIFQSKIFAHMRNGAGGNPNMRVVDRTHRIATVSLPEHTKQVMPTPAELEKIVQETLREQADFIANAAKQIGKSPETLASAFKSIRI